MTIYDILFCFFTYSFLGWCTEVAFAAVRQKRKWGRTLLQKVYVPICHLDAERRKQ